ncbi:tyrosine-type recombinase/integrase [Litorisediminicola beolgyonensis]|uniref:Tyrosine-type recombinase/integrase n=1 Tax=Litorisediminicola beolgyonensis TaxID=1173614 RepID=A0ABW3ZJM5_9RHOB
MRTRSPSPSCWSPRSASRTSRHWSSTCISSARVYLVLEDVDTKTGRPIEFELPSDVVRHLDQHLATRTPLLCPPGTTFLFPKRTGERGVDRGALSGRIAKRIRKETGLKMNAHRFRHFAVMTWLDANPGGYEVAKRLLGHSEVSHTINMYSGMEARSAARVYSNLIGTLKGATT